jgi:hypothetical protein
VLVRVPSPYASPSPSPEAVASAHLAEHSTARAKRDLAWDHSSWGTTLNRRMTSSRAPDSMAEPQAAIRQYLEHNDAPTPFVWTKTAVEIFASIERYCLRTSGSERQPAALPRRTRLAPTTWSCGAGPGDLGRVSAGTRTCGRRRSGLRRRAAPHGRRTLAWSRRSLVGTATVGTASAVMKSWNSRCGVTVSRLPSCFSSISRAPTFWTGPGEPWIQTT